MQGNLHRTSTDEGLKHVLRLFLQSVGEKYTIPESKSPFSTTATWNCAGPLALLRRVYMPYAKAIVDLKLTNCSLIQLLDNSVIQHTARRQHSSVKPSRVTERVNVDQLASVIPAQRASVTVSSSTDQRVNVDQLASVIPAQRVSVTVSSSTDHEVVTPAQRASATDEHADIGVSMKTNPSTPKPVISVKMIPDVEVTGPSVVKYKCP